MHAVLVNSAVATQLASFAPTQESCRPAEMKSLLALVAAVAVVAAAAGGIEYRKFHVESEIVSRYSTTAITSVVLNNDDVSRELSFQVQLPETAFISNFTM